MQVACSANSFRAISMALVTAFAMLANPGTASAGLNAQGLNPQGLNPQGLNPQGLNPQGLNPQGIRLHDVFATTLELAGLPLMAVVQGSDLWGISPGSIPVVLHGEDLIGATLLGSMQYVDGDDEAWQEVILRIDDVVQDLDNNTMTLCSTSNRSCPDTPYSSNHDVLLYRIEYQVPDSGEASAPLCGGDGLGMFFAGYWDAAGVWVDDDTALTFSCNDGVLAKCARGWGYKPWRDDMRDMYGVLREDMGRFHQACVRAAMADYGSQGYSATITSTTIDIFDNAGFNTPTSAAELQSLGFEPTMWFEAIFTSKETEVVGSMKSDYWSYYLGSPRFGDIALFEDSYDYEIEWGSVSPKTFSTSTPIASAEYYLEQGYNDGRVELAVFNPLWQALGYGVASGFTSDSFDHFTPSCRPSSNAPDRVHRWTAPAAGTYTISTLGSIFDTVLYVYRDGDEIACNDDASGLTSSVLVSVSAGEELMIFVDGYSAASGHYMLNILP